MQRQLRAALAPPVIDVASAPNLLQLLALIPSPAS
jgi:hypothetical protein